MTVNLPSVRDHGTKALSRKDDIFVFDHTEHPKTFAVSLLLFYKVVYLIVKLAVSYLTLRLAQIECGLLSSHFHNLGFLAYPLLFG